MQEISVIDKRGQLTLFVLAGVLIILAIVVFFLFFGADIETSEAPTKSPRVFIERCIFDAVTPSIIAVLANGGLIDTAFAIKYKDHDYNYLCYNGDYYGKCYNNYPMLQRISEEQIRSDSVLRVDECFTELFDDYDSRGLGVTENGVLNYSVEIIPGSVRLRVNREFSATKGESNEIFTDFDMTIPTDLYDLIGVARGIVNSEAQYCYFETNGFMVLYPEYNVSRFDYYESKIYEVQNRQTKEVLAFAVRSCAYAPGF
ncbi:MAG: hypothetical protein ACI83O_000565 [Patescibacteria group bacterium]|jgi:hypothetical protein